MFSLNSDLSNFFLLSFLDADIALFRANRQNINIKENKFILFLSILKFAY